MRRCCASSWSQCPLLCVVIGGSGGISTRVECRAKVHAAFLVSWSGVFKGGRQDCTRGSPQLHKCSVANIDQCKLRVCAEIFRLLNSVDTNSFTRQYQPGKIGEVAKLAWIKPQAPEVPIHGVQVALFALVPQCLGIRFCHLFSLFACAAFGDGYVYRYKEHHICNHSAVFVRFH